MTTVLNPTRARKAELDPALLELPQEERQVTILLKPNSFSFYIDPLAKLITPTGQESSLVAVQGARLYPQFTLTALTEHEWVMLVFEPLPADCTQFDFIEPEREDCSPWIVRGIPRNDTDVYEVSI